MAQKQLPPEGNPGIPQEFLDQVNAEADRQVEDLVKVAESIFASIPERVSLRIKSLKVNWANINFASGGASTNTGGEFGV